MDDFILGKAIQFVTGNQIIHHSEARRPTSILLRSVLIAPEFGIELLTVNKTSPSTPEDESRHNEGYWDNRTK